MIEKNIVALAKTGLLVCLATITEQAKIADAFWALFFAATFELLRTQRPIPPSTG
jgi:hypothetical protein